MERENHKNQRAEEIIMRVASDFILQESNHQSLITITNTSTSKDFQNCTIFVTVFPEHKEEAALDFLRRQRKNFKLFVKAKTRLNKIPLFDFKLDLGEKSRQRVEELL